LIGLQGKEEALVMGSMPPLSPHAWLRYSTLRRLVPAEARTVLEIGCGLGSAGVLLARRYDYLGLEPDRDSFEIARERIGNTGRVLDIDLESLDHTQTFDVVCAFEVLEHLEDDRAALNAWLGHVRPGGWLLLSVPAGSHRFGPTDVKAGHYRRYDRTVLEALLASSGLDDVAVRAYGFPLGYALEAGRNAILRRRSRGDAGGTAAERTAASGRWLQPPDWSAAATQVAAAPFALAQRPFAHTSLGTGFVARGRCPAG
jgi:SAM-dependent methyltransferase